MLNNENIIFLKINIVIDYITVTLHCFLKILVLDFYTIKVARSMTITLFSFCDTLYLPM